jgi:hypothetical protein
MTRRVYRNCPVRAARVVVTWRWTMLSLRWRQVLVLFVLPVLFGLPQPAHAGPGVVWLSAHSQGHDEEVRVRVPLEWLANAENEGHSEIRLDDETLDCTQLWRDYRDLPIGESREVRRGVTKDGESYIVQVSAEGRSSKHCEGKVHILTRESDGESTDVRFPLDLGGLLQQLGSLVGSFFGDDDPRHMTARGHEIDAAKIGNLKDLGGYGPFVFLQATEADGSKVKISIE